MHAVRGQISLLIEGLLEALRDFFIVAENRVDRRFITGRAETVLRSPSPLRQPGISTEDIAEASRVQIIRRFENQVIVYKNIFTVNLRTVFKLANYFSTVPFRHNPMDNRAR
jgi:hypothetical protein